MDKASFILNFKEKMYPIPTIFQHAFDISHDIFNCLIFNQNHSYTVNSNVSEEVFESFIEYLINDKLPNIILDNIHEYIELSQEFHLLEDIINEKKKIFGECLINLMCFHQRENKDTSKYEEGIANNLDEYIEKYSKNLMHLPIHTLFNIFNHKNRILDNHNMAYDFIKSLYQDTGNLFVFILLSTLKGSKLTKENLSEAISLRDQRMNYMPNIDFSYLERNITEIKEFESQVENCSINISGCKEKFDNEINVLKCEHSNEIKKLEKKYIDEIESLKIVIKQNEIKYLKEIEELNKKFILLSTQINEKIQKETESLKSIIDERNEKIEELNQKEDKLKKEIESLNNIIIQNERKYQNLKEISLSNLANYKKEYELLSKKIDLIKNNIPNINDFVVNIDINKSGILENLKMKEKNHFDQFFVASQSSCDIYNLIDPNTEDSFCTPAYNRHIIEFELEKKVTINGMKIYSSFKYFPKSFNIEIDGEIVFTTSDAEELNGKNKEMVINFNQKRTKKIKFVKIGPNWDKNTEFVMIKRIEFLSNESEYSNGVFATLVNKSENKDPHKSHVFITTTNYGFNSFYSGKISGNISTLNESNSWFQIELTHGFAFLTGFLLEKGHHYESKNFKIIGTDDIRNPIDSWITLIEINEKTLNDHGNPDVYKFNKLSPPVRFVRLIQIGPNWSDNNFLKFHHFDLFGRYIDFNND